ncbi:MBL fold metallo-hydrolase [Natrinema versiforme]|uniref:Beta-lactamase domain protein n=1 Tax=Natrinema versiforme JCM 10478 TaxID=1227496 RepID=L9XT35_9EURY|nr:MBL fold metallo-hydrolase [Natrinema versiforme]ELY64940.1 beta-lactamase domain protein [Natrinema versiforme JCM 10478]
MEVGDVREVTTGDCSDLYYLDTGMYDTNEYGAVYILDDERPAVVDTGIGTNYDLLREALAEVGIGEDDLEVIALTHIHLDHAGGAGFLAADYPNADVYVHPIGVDHLADPSRLVAGTKNAVGDQWEYYVDPEPIPEDRIVTIEDGDAIDLGAHELRVHAAPGHAPHQVVFEDPENDAVFVADAAGIWVPEIETIRETSPPSNFDLEQCLADLETLSAIDPDVFCYPHFGPRSVDGDVDRALEEYAAVLEEWVEAVAEQRAALDGTEAVVDHFADATEMTDVWGEEKASEEAKLNTRGVLGYLEHRE